MRTIGDTIWFFIVRFYFLRWFHARVENKPHKLTHKRNNEQGGKKQTKELSWAKLGSASVWAISLYGVSPLLCNTEYGCPHPGNIHVAIDGNLWIFPNECTNNFHNHINPTQNTVMTANILPLWHFFFLSLFYRSFIARFIPIVRDIY